MSKINLYNSDCMTAKKLKEGNMIGINTIRKASLMIEGLLETYLPDIDKAVRKAEEGAGVNISISLKLKPINLQETDIEAGISFTTEKIKDSTSQVVNENQLELFSNLKDGAVKISTTRAEL